MAMAYLTVSGTTVNTFTMNTGRILVTDTTGTSTTTMVTSIIEVTHRTKFIEPYCRAARLDRVCLTEDRGSIRGRSRACRIGPVDLLVWCIRSGVPDIVLH